MEVEITTKSGMVISTGFTRIVHGKRGSYLEVDSNYIVRDNIYIPKDVEWRQSPRYDYVYYDEYRSRDRSYTMVYLQRRRVAYADYKVGFWYMSVDDVVGYSTILLEEEKISG